MIAAGGSDGHVAAVLWDVEGTLVRRVRSDVEIAARELARHGIDLASIDPRTLQEAQRHLAAHVDLWSADEEIAGYAQVVQLLLSGQRHPSNLIDHLASAFATAYDAFEPVLGIQQLLTKVRAVGIRQGVVSNWPGSLGRFLAHLNLHTHLDVIVSSGAVGVLKPDPALLTRALRRLDVDPSATVVIGNDPVTDIVPAQRLGCATLHFDPVAAQDGAITTVTALDAALVTLVHPA